MQQNMASPLHHEFLLYTSNMFVHIAVDGEIRNPVSPIGIMIL